MRTEPPLATLRRRLAARPGPITGADSEPGGDGDDDEDPDGEVLAPSWVPDGRPPRGWAWLAAARADPGRAGGVALVAIAALAVLVTVFTLVRTNPPAVASAKLPPVEMTSTAAAGPSSPGPGTPSRDAPEPQVVVSVVGLVHQPGLVTLAPSARVADAVTAAGGTLSGADTLGLNMARHVADGEQIVVGITMPAGQAPALGSSAGPRAAGPSPTGGGPKPVGPVDLNTATVEQLDALPGVGPVTAASIVAWRQANGKFTDIDQLGEVDGIGPARLEKLRPLVRI